MGLRAHRIKKVTYAKGVLFKLGEPLADAIINHADTNDLRNSGSGIIEIPLRGLIEILDHAKRHKLSIDDFNILKAEIETLKKEGKDEESYISYDIY